MQMSTFKPCRLHAVCATASDRRAIADFQIAGRERTSLASDIDVLRENWLKIVASPAKTNPDFFRLTERHGLIPVAIAVVPSIAE